ncbi:MAG: murein biosynthesis integral membrane protein MurJ, partial [Anaerolineae bacterium]
MAGESKSQARALGGQQLAQAAGLVVVGFIMSRLLGLVRNALLNATFGAGFELDAYNAALRPPETIFLVVAGGALASAFIPTFTDYLAEGKRSDAWRLANSVIVLVTLVMIALSVASMIFAPQIASTLLAPEFPADKQQLTTALLRIMLLTPIIFGISGLMMALLNAHQRFFLPAIAPAVYNLGIIMGVLVFAPSIGIFGAAWGAVLGALGHLLVQIPGLIAIELPFQPQQTRINHPGVGEVLRLMGPRVLGLAVIQINFWVNIALASGMVEGSVTALQNAFYVLLLPQGVIAQSLATAVFPTFSAQVSEGRTDQLAVTLGQVLRAVLFLSIPATVGLVILRLPISRLIFEYGEFTFAASQATAWALLFYGMGLASHALVEVLSRVFYALHDTWTPVVVGGGAMALNVGLSFWLITWVGQPDSLAMGPFAGLALANTIATTLEALLRLVLIIRRVGGLDVGRLSASAGRSALVSAIMGA